MNIGYARVSTKKQNLDLQLDALRAKGCEKIYSEKISGVKEGRPELDRAMEVLREGDHFYVWSIDRLGRNLYQVIKTVSDLRDKGVILHAISQNIDTSTSTGKIFLTVFALLADLEMDLRRERAQAGIEAARARKITGGRKAGLTETAKKKAVQAKMLYLSEDPVYSTREIYETLNISSRTLYKYLSFLGVERRVKDR